MTPIAIFHRHQIQSDFRYIPSYWLVGSKGMSRWRVSIHIKINSVYFVVVVDFCNQFSGKSHFSAQLFGVWRWNNKRNCPIIFNWPSCITTISFSAERVNHKPILEEQPQNATEAVGTNHTFKCEFISDLHLSKVQWVLGTCLNCSNTKVLKVMVKHFSHFKLKFEWGKSYCLFKFNSRFACMWIH